MAPLETVLAIGIAVRNAVLDVAGLLKVDAAPGLVTLGLLLALVLGMILFIRRIAEQRSAIRMLTRLILETGDGANFSRSISELNSKVAAIDANGSRRKLATAWQEYRETFVPHEEAGNIILRNSVRPSAFFNSEDLGFGSGFWRIVPGLFVTIGLLLTFLGLISALGSMDLSQGKVEASLKDLLNIASAKFIMSLTGLFCSIIFTVLLRTGLGQVEKSLHSLSAAIERRLTFISLEALAVEQLAATREQREHFRMIGLELVAELGRPLREELPVAISTSITSAISPILAQVGQMGSENLGTMVKDLSARFSDDVGNALTQASGRLAQAGDRIAELSDRLVQNSGQMGREMDAAILRLAEAVTDLRGSIGLTAETASGAFAEGADRLLSVMNQTLEGIRDNTGQGARAMGDAALRMHEAAEAFKNELVSASKMGSEAVRDQISSAGARASGVIDDAGREVLDAFSRTATGIAQATESLSAKATNDLLGPLDQMSAQLNGLVQEISNGTEGLRRLHDGIRSSADATEKASNSLRSASTDLVAAVTPIRATNDRIEANIQQLTESTKNVATTIVRSAELTAQRATDALSAAKEVLGGQSRAIEASLKALATMVEKLKGQGERLDNIDEKLGTAFDQYTNHVEAAVNSLFGHVKRMQDELAPALDTLRTIVEQAEQFSPESKRR